MTYTKTDVTETYEAQLREDIGVDTLHRSSMNCTAHGHGVIVLALYTPGESGTVSYLTPEVAREVAARLLAGADAEEANP
jgi:hypothetical protein